MRKYVLTLAVISIVFLILDGRTQKKLLVTYYGLVNGTTGLLSDCQIEALDGWVVKEATPNHLKYLSYYAKENFLGMYSVSKFDKDKGEDNSLFDNCTTVNIDGISVCGFYKQEQEEANGYQYLYYLKEPKLKIGASGMSELFKDKIPVIVSKIRCNS